MSGRFLVAFLLLAAPRVPAEGPADEAFQSAKRLQEEGKWAKAQKAFRAFLKEYPDSPHRLSAEERSGDNAYLGCTKVWESGPAARRIDVAVMGDGFTLDENDQTIQERWAHDVARRLWQEPLFSEYRNFFNIYFVRLASKEKGVDRKQNPKKAKKQKDYDTALDAKSAGPGGQVLMDRRLVYKWLEIAAKDIPACADDRYVIAFARFGHLGMGGWGVANMGRPDKAVTVHEFGHAFSRLLDEYVSRDGTLPAGMRRTIRAANAATDPDPKTVPWAHMLKARVKGVGIHEGGATWNKGVWRPASTCAMNIGGAPFCPVCREQTLLVMYEYVSPIDRLEPATDKPVEAKVKGRQVLTVFPMPLEEQAMDVRWYVSALGARDPKPKFGSDADAEDDDTGDIMPVSEGPGADSDRPNPGFTGPRARGARKQYAKSPDGERSKLGKIKKARRKRPRYAYFPVGKLPRGRYWITVEVRDKTPWVVKDDKRLLVERATWFVRVSDP